MYSSILPIIAVIYVAVITYLSYRLGQAKTENPKGTALIGFLLSFIPPIALIYLVVLLFKDDVDVV